MFRMYPWLVAVGIILGVGLSVATGFAVWVVAHLRERRRRVRAHAAAAVAAEVDIELQTL